MNMKRKRNYLILIILTVFFSLCWFNCVDIMACEHEDEKIKPDSVSTGAELIEWLESHKNTGGKVKLSDNVVLEGAYYYCPGTINLPPVFIDTNNHVITITGEIEFRSDNHLIFQGRAEGKKDIIHVARGGILSLSGVIIENEQIEKTYTLWQEEGAGLVIEKCRISGKIHYAHTPFVIDNESVCVVVEKNQTADNVLPTEIKCSVNSKGEVYNNEQMKVSWILSGTEKEQKERLRFSTEGSFVDAGFLEPPVCTVVYNDYILTFMKVNGFISGNSYIFRGTYLKPKEYLPMTVTYEYSFDGEKWIDYEKVTASDIEDTFFIGLTLDQWDTEKYPYLYLRLMGKHNENIYFSNVLRYTADNFKIVTDQGGNRGGGTSIISPPNEPPKSPDNVSENLNAETFPEVKQENNSNENLMVEDKSAKTEADKETIDVEINAVHSVIVNAEVTNSSENKVLPKTIEEDKSQNLSDTESAETKSINQSINGYETGREYINANTPDTSDEKIQSSEESFYSQSPEAKQDASQNKAAVVVSGIIFSSVLAGSAGYCFHARIFHQLHQVMKIMWIK